VIHEWVCIRDRVETHYEVRERPSKSREKASGAVLPALLVQFSSRRGATGSAGPPAAAGGEVG